MKTKIFVCTYEDKVFCDNDIFTPIQVGKQYSHLDLGCLSDDTGDNIAYKNPYYSEQTSLYWIWKNVKGLDCVGIMQYRKLLQLNKKKSVKTDLSLTETEFNQHPDIDALMQGCDIILANPLKFRVSLTDKYRECHISKDLDILEETIKQYSPEYYDAFCTTMKSVPGILHSYNIFVMRWKWFDAYCSWIFPLFSILESKLDLENHTGYQRRVFGYMAERLLNVFCLKNKLLVRTRPAVLIKEYYTKDKEEKQIKAIIESLVGKKNIENAGKEGSDDKSDKTSDMSNSSKGYDDMVTDTPINSAELHETEKEDVQHTKQKGPKSILYRY